MRRLPAAWFAIACLLAPGAGWAFAGRRSVVPIRVQRTVLNLYGKQMAFVPSRPPAGYRYQGWSHSRKPSHYEYQFNLVKKDSTGEIVAAPSFQVIRRPCPSAPSWPAQGYFRLNGHKIAWSRTNADTYAWRCLSTKGHTFVIFGVNGSVRTDAFLVAYAEPAR